LRLLADMREDLKTSDRTWSIGKIYKYVSSMVSDHLARHPWTDHSEHPLTAPFKLTIATGKSGAGTCEWPQRTWEHDTCVSGTLQSAHLCITLLLSAGRIGEIATLNRDCVKIRRDGKSYLHGCTYKLSGNLFGDARTWPAPDILAKSLGQQARLAAAWDWLPN